MGIFEGQGDSLFEKSFSVFKANNIGKPNIWILNEDISLKVSSQLSKFRHIRIVRYSFQNSDIEEIFIFIFFFARSWLYNYKEYDWVSLNFNVSALFLLFYFFRLDRIFFLKVCFISRYLRFVGILGGSSNCLLMLEFICFCFIAAFFNCSYVFVFSAFFTSFGGLLNFIS